MNRLRKSALWGTASALLAVGILSCAKISRFDEPYLQETFMGSLAITPSLRGLSAGARATGAVSIVGNKDGRTVTIYGLPKNDPFDLVPNLSSSLPMNVAGFEAEVVDAMTLKITGFSDVSQGAKSLEPQVSGTLVREGPRLSTLPGEPIVISAKAGAIRKKLPEALRSMITLIDTDETIDEIEEDEVIPMYQIKFRGDVTSIF